MGIEKERILNALTAAGNKGAFYAEKYDPDTERLLVDRGKVISPLSAIADETACTWVPSRNKRQPFIRQRSVWTFKLILSFSQKVSTEQFEDDMGDDPICLPRDPDRNLTAVALLLQRVTYTHPPRQQPSSGTIVEIFFEAQLSPR